MIHFFERNLLQVLTWLGAEFDNNK